MTSGIYALKFSGTDKLYIGQSQNIEYRYKKHKQNLVNGKHNYKMIEAYKLYGIPELIILLDNVPISELSENETLAFEIFDCISNGLNVAPESSIHESGDKNPAAKYTNEQIVQAMNFLLDIKNSYKEISTKTNVSISTIRHIACLEAHAWLGEKYPLEYSKLKQIKLDGGRRFNKNTAEDRGITYPVIVSPDNIEYTVTNASAFAKQHNLDASSLVKVLKQRNKYNSHKGWKLKI